MSAGPYRSEADEPRFVCLACYAHASIAGGLCPRCNVDLVPLARDDVRADLRAEAERRMQKQQYGEYFGTSLLGFLIVSPLLLLHGQLIFELGYVLCSLGAGELARRAYAAMVPRSALALYAERRKRLNAALTGRAQLQLPASHAREVVEGSGDPEEMSLEETLRWLGATGPQRR